MQTCIEIKFKVELLMLEDTLIVDHTKRKRILPNKSLLRCPKCNKIGERQVSDNKKYVQYIHTKYNSNRILSCMMKAHQENSLKNSK